MKIMTPMTWWKMNCVTNTLRLPWWCSGKESACQFWRLEFDPWIRKIPRRWKQQPTPVFLPGKSPWIEEPGGLQSMGLQKSQT